MSTPTSPQNDLNLRLWAMLQAYVPGARWKRALTETFDHVEWLCQGPDDRFFVANAHFYHGRWYWEFTVWTEGALSITPA